MRKWYRHNTENNGKKIEEEITGVTSIKQQPNLNSSYLQSSEQLAAMLYPGDVKKLIDGSVGQLRAKLCVSLNGIQDLVFILWSSHLKKTSNSQI